MAKFQEDMIFKNVFEEDVRLFLDILGLKSKKVKIITHEFIQKNLKNFTPDIILELDDEILIIELQTTPVTNNKNKRFHIYLALATYYNKSKKQVKLCVFTNAEESKQVKLPINDDNSFKYDVISLSNYDSEKIINTINYKKDNDIKITRKELILYALVPLIAKNGNVEDYIDDVVHNLVEFKEFDDSIKSLAYGIEWLIVDKFVEDDLKRYILCSLFGDKMSLIDEYGQSKVRKTEDRIIGNQLKAGLDPQVLAITSKIPLSRVNEIKRKYKL